MQIKQLLLVGAFFGLPLSFGSTVAAAKLDPLVSLGADFGGDTIVDVVYTDGSKSKIEAGRGIHIAGGLRLDLNEAIEAQTTLGIKWTSTKQASNGVIDFYRFPIEFLVLYRIDKFRAGAGFTYHLNNKIKGTKDAAIATGELKDAAGVVIQGDYFFDERKNAALGLKYTVIRYEPNAISTKVNGNSIGAVFTYLFL